MELVSLAQLSRDGAWRTEAMRSYERPVLVWFTRGQGRFTAAGRTVGFGAHNIFVMPAGTMHGFSMTGPTLGYLVFLPSDLDWPKEPMHLRLTDAKMQREMTTLIEDLRREAEDAALDYQSALFHRAGLLSVWLGRTIARLLEAEERPRRRTERAGDRLAAAYSLLVERDFRKPVGVQHFAEELGVTPTHLTRVCRQTAGRPALDILNDRRHFEARRLLRDTKMKIADVARASGFSSAAYFTRAFRAQTGQSPSEFRSGR